MHCCAANIWAAATTGVANSAAITMSESYRACSESNSLALTRNDMVMIYTLSQTL